MVTEQLSIILYYWSSPPRRTLTGRDKENLDNIYDRRNICPYTEECESFNTIRRAERWMGKAIRDLRRSDAEKTPEAEGGYHINTLQYRLEHVRKIKKRCYNHHGRCLRFWQLKNGKEKLGSRRIESIQLLSD
jgi:hypothetical protein